MSVKSPLSGGVAHALDFTGGGDCTANSNVLVSAMLRRSTVFSKDGYFGMANRLYRQCCECQYGS